jgi:ABC-type transporter Mla subunit MlaD
MANPAEDRSLRKDVEAAGANVKKEAESGAGRVGEEIQRAKEQISQTAATARDDVSENLRALSDDIARLKDTVAGIAKTVGVQIGDAASDITSEIASSAKDQAGTVVAEFERVARRNPLAVVAGALCVGMVIGLMSGRR